MRLHSKGLIFALDAALAVTVVVLMVVNSTYYFSLSGKSSLAHLQSIKFSDDIITLFDYQGVLDDVVINDTKGAPGNTPSIDDDLMNVSYYLPANYEMWVSISDLKETITGTPFCSSTLTDFFSEPLERDMDALVQVSITGVSGGSGSLVINVTTKEETFDVSQDGIYVVGIFPFVKGVNTVRFKANNLCVAWFKVLGSEAYAALLESSPPFPTDRFIGAGERYFTVEKPWTLNPGENPIEGVHIVRYRVWLKGGT